MTEFEPRTLVVLESPYAGDLVRNKAYLNACIRDSVARGEAPFASHQMYTDALDDTVPEERHAGIGAGIAWGGQASQRAVYVDLGVSKGMTLGIRANAHVPVVYRSLRAPGEDMTMQDALEYIGAGWSDTPPPPPELGYYALPAPEIGIYRVCVSKTPGTYVEHSARNDGRGGWYEKDTGAILRGVYGWKRVGGEASEKGTT